MKLSAGQYHMEGDLAHMHGKRQNEELVSNKSKF